MNETHCVTIQIVGTTSGGETFHRELSDLFERLQAVLPETMPHFVLAQPPATITTFELFGAITAKRVDIAFSQQESALIEAACAAVDAIRGDGNGRAWIDARAADHLRAVVECWRKAP